MNVLIDRSFEKDTDKIGDSELLIKVADIIDQVRNSSNWKGIRNIKKLQGSNNYYRIRIGDYRIGSKIAGNTITFIRFLHRKEIYRVFP